MIKENARSSPALAGIDDHKTENGRIAAAVVVAAVLLINPLAGAELPVKSILIVPSTTDSLTATRNSFGGTARTIFQARMD